MTRAVLDDRVDDGGGNRDEDEDDDNEDDNKRDDVETPCAGVCEGKLEEGRDSDGVDIDNGIVEKY